MDLSIIPVHLNFPDTLKLAVLSLSRPFRHSPSIEIHFRPQAKVKSSLKALLSLARFVVNSCLLFSSLLLFFTPILSSFSFLSQLLSRAKAHVDPKDAAKDSVKKRKEVPTLHTYLDRRDYVGAITLLEFTKNTGSPLKETEEWLGYCNFHLGNVQKAYGIYLDVARGNPEYWTQAACCAFMLGMYKECDDAGSQAPGNNPLLNRVMFHLSHKFNDETRLMEHHRQLNDVTEDQLTLASIHYLRSHYQEAIDIYKRILGEHPYVYVAFAVFLSRSRSRSRNTHARARAHTHTHTHVHARTHTHVHARTHAHLLRPPNTMHRRLLRIHAKITPIGSLWLSTFTLPSATTSWTTTTTRKTFSSLISKRTRTAPPPST